MVLLNILYHFLNGYIIKYLNDLISDPVQARDNQFAYVLWADSDSRDVTTIFDFNDHNNLQVDITAGLKLYFDEILVNK